MNKHQGRLIKGLRKHHNFTQNELAEYLGMNHKSAIPMISNMEKGKIPIPSTIYERLVKLKSVGRDRLIQAVVRDFEYKFHSKLASS